jgi:hypothetical protein
MIIKDIPRLFINEFEKKSPSVTKRSTDILDIDYCINSYGYRGNEFLANTDILILGCSQTYGTGLPYEYTWPYILAQKLNMNFSNLAMPGESIALQTIRAFYYFQKFGNPKMIVGLFPIYRMPTVYVNGKMEKVHRGKYDDMRNEDWKKTVESSDLSGDQFEKYSKAPHVPEEVLPKELAFFYDSVFIDILRQYCKANSIKLAWSVWDGSYQDSIYPKINNFYPEHHNEYCMIEAFNFKMPNSKQQDFYLETNALDCHQDMRSEELFYKAADRPVTQEDFKRVTFSHWGLHKNIHIAEDFYKHITLTNLN